MDKLKELNGKEVWSNSFGDRFGERVCVLVDYPFLVHNGEKFKPTKEEINGLWDDVIRNEFGSHKQMMADLEDEFGGVSE